MVEASPPAAAHDAALAPGQLAGHFADLPHDHEASHQSSKESIALELRAPYGEVDQVYEQELMKLAPEAKITQFLGVIVSRRVRMRLRRRP